MKQNIMLVLDDTRKQLSVSKRIWLNKLDQLKKQIADANQVFRREHTKYQTSATNVEDLKKKRDDQYKKFGLDLNERIEFDNMPKQIQLAE